ncbi:MAG: hypothetical protein BIFFINMI_02263 [Phycisphaerae bacterium]|nr:hypothetical protein [Phycisphaerae bacterium]
MRILVDVKHPADVLLLAAVRRALLERGDEVIVTSRPKDETEALLEAMSIPHTCLAPIRSGVAGMALELAIRARRMYRLVSRRPPDCLIARAGITVGMVGRALGRPSITIDDTETATLQVRLFTPLADAIWTGLGYGRTFGGKQVCADSLTQLFYTHPARFTPDPGALRACGVDPARPYVVVRVNSWRALHDIGVHAASDRELADLVRALEPIGRPIVSSERPLPESMRPYASPVPVARMLDLLACARLYVGEGASMAAEAGCLGVPAVLVNPLSRRGYLDFLGQRFGHVATIRTPEEALAAAKGLISRPAAESPAALRSRIAAELADPLPSLLTLVDRLVRRRLQGG